MTTVKELLNDNKANLMSRLDQMATSKEDLEILKKTMAEIERRANR